MTQIVRASSFCRKRRLSRKIIPTPISSVEDNIISCTTNKLLFHIVIRKNDYSNIVYVSSINTLKECCIVSGNLVWLHVAENSRKVIVQIVYDHNTTTSTTTTTTGASSGQQQQSEQEINSCNSNQDLLCLNEITAINLGYNYLSTNNCKNEKISLEPFVDIVEDAIDVTICMIGRPVIQFSQRISEEEENDTSKWPLPKNGTILQCGTIVTVQHDDEVYFYEVIQINGSTKQCTVAHSTSTTRYRFILDGITTSLVPKLPSFHYCNSKVPHPDVTTLMKHLQFIGTSISERIIHLIGTQYEHHIIDAIKVTANNLGRRCIVTTGLAATAYILNGNITTSGQLVDKLAGLDAVIDLAYRHAPSILLIQDIDQEFSRNDDSLRKSEESRIWSLIIEKLFVRTNNNNQQSNLPIQVPAVLVVLTSQAEFKPGPILENLVYPSIQASQPDKDYIKYLWEEYEKEDKDCLSEYEIPIDTVQSLMETRPANEIIGIREEFVCVIKRQPTQLDDKSIIGLLETICQKKDEERRLKSGLGRIPKVQWDDVGGLEHVRSEILDAIELPLKYSHLFPPGMKGRSGLLLYGPPGTGKTFVAKAVATECGLPFLSIKGPELLGSFIGESETQIRSTFEQARILARQNQPNACILFFDELDSLAPRRGDQASGGNVMDRVVATLFAELDKVDDTCLVFCIGATNRPDLLDPALLRPGRLDRLVYLGISTKDFPSILATHLKKVRIDGNVDEVSKLVADKLPSNLTGADLSSVVSNALTRATERLCNKVDEELKIQCQQNQSSADNNNMMCVDDILATWDDDELDPIVLLSDLFEAAENTIPSVSVDELEKYSQLKEKFSSQV